MKRNIYLVFAAALLFAACSEGPEGPVASNEQSGPEVNTLHKADGAPDITDRYIVVFKDDVGNPRSMAAEMTRGKGITTHFTYQHAIKGFAATIPEQALEGIRRNPNVAYIEPDGLVYKTATQNNPPSWGLDRIDQRDLPMDSKYVYQNEGQGVNIYIIDTGIKFNHQEYNGRAFSGYDFVDNDNDASDCDGHGTHVAGTAAGTNVGVAKKATLYAVRVLDCNGSGTYSGVIAGIDWVTQNHVKPAVANMSLGGGYSSSVNTAVNNSVAAGVVYAVSAGNSNSSACNYSPASAADAITVGATESNDKRASYSNYGSCVDIFAPGSGIYSSTINGGYASWNGTSMASPHVAGVAALYLASNTSATPANVTNAILNGASANKLTGNLRPGSPNLLLYSLIAGAVSTNPPADPSNLTATAAASAPEITLSWSDNSNDEDGFNIERWDGSNYVQIASVGADVTTFTNTGLNYNTSYTYRVAAYNSAGNSGYTNTASATTAQLTAPTAPSNLSAGTVTASSVAMTWTDNATNEDSYEVKRSADGGVTWSLLATLGQDATSYTDNTVAASTSYKYQVFAKNSAGSTGSNIIDVTTPTPSNDITISSITTASISDRSQWQGEFTITIVDGSNNPVANATVTGGFSGGSSGTAQAITGSNGQVTVASDWMHKNVGSVTFTVTNVTHATETWDGVQKSATAVK